LPAWGTRPGSIYISASQAETLEWGSSDYKVRIYGDFGANPYTDYVLLDADWRGSEMTLLDRWVITQAGVIAVADGEDMTESVADLGEVLNSRGHVIFVNGIPYLDVARPEIFAVVARDVAPDDIVHNPLTTDLETSIGTELYDVAEDWGAIFGGVSAKDFMGMMLLLLFCVMVVGGAFLGPIGIILGFCVGYVGLLWGTWVGAVDWVILGVVTFIAVVIFIWTKFASK